MFVDGLNLASFPDDGSNRASDAYLHVLSGLLLGQM
jgi:hypothetical protein